MLSSFVFVVLSLFLNGVVVGTRLDDYVNDDSDINVQNYTILSNTVHERHREYLINITTLRWFDETLSSQSIWHHNLFVYTPLNLRSIKNKALLFIGGGFNDNSTFNDKGAMRKLAVIADECNCVTALLEQVPNQPITFDNDPEHLSRIEDEIISFTWKMYIEEKVKYKNATKKTDYLLLLMPMTKAVVRTMDFLQTFIYNNYKTEIDGFVLSGASKRGWTAWLTAAVDDRVVGIVPVVFDMLNQPASFHHQYRSYGGAYSFAFMDYFDAGIISYIDTPEFIESLQLLDPYNYFDRYKQMKVLLVLAANDEFFLPENTKFFWNKLMAYTNENAYIRWLPNIGHSVKREIDALFSSIKFFLLTFTEAEKYSLPKFRWSFNQNFTHMSAQLRIEDLSCPQIPALFMYTAQTVSTERRDFRYNILNGLGVAPQNVTYNLIKLNNFNLINPKPNSFKISYTAKNDLSKLKSHWQASFIQIGVFLNKQTCLDSELFYLTTEIFVVPDVYPVGDCFRQECNTRLV